MKLLLCPRRLVRLLVSLMIFLHVPPTCLNFSLNSLRTFWGLRAVKFLNLFMAMKWIYSNLSTTSERWGVLVRLIGEGLSSFVCFVIIFSLTSQKITVSPLLLLLLNNVRLGVLLLCFVAENCCLLWTILRKIRALRWLAVFIYCR